MNLDTLKSSVLPDERTQHAADPKQPAAQLVRLGKQSIFKRTTTSASQTSETSHESRQNARRNAI